MIRLTNQQTPGGVTMSLALIPQPKKITLGKGTFAVPRKGTIGISGQELYAVALEVASIFEGYSVATALPKVADTITVRCKSGLKPGGYRLKSDAEKGVTIDAETPKSAFYAVQTLAQIAAQAHSRKLRCVTITDWPDFAERGVYLDLTRGRVPKVERLMQQVDHLSTFKINQFQIYLEHTFKFRQHPSIGKGASPMTADEVLDLDAYCRYRGVELVPSFATFGHLGNVLTLPEYRHLAEDYGIGKYVDETTQAHRIKGWTLSPANPKIYDFLDSLFAELLPLFSSEKFNICCDETWDLGLGQTHDLCKKQGKGRVYLDHIIKLRDLAAKYGKRIQFWGDIIRHYPELIPEIPTDVTVLDWGYENTHPFARIRDFKKAGLPFFACPGTSSWGGMFPRIPNAEENIAGFAAAAKRNGADGLLNTDWGDGGHYNFMEYSWPGYVFGAEQAWNTRADRASFMKRFCRVFLNTSDPAMARGITAMGEASHILWAEQYFFGRPGSDAYTKRENADYVDASGKSASVKFDARLGVKLLKKLEGVRTTLEKHGRAGNEDPVELLPYWIFAADSLIHAARKLSVFGRGGEDNKADRRLLKREMTGLMKRFEVLWLDRSKRSEIRITLRKYRAAIAAL
jgi:hexosaminidase